MGESKKSKEPKRSGSLQSIRSSEEEAGKPSLKGKTRSGSLQSIRKAPAKKKAKSSKGPVRGR